MILISLLLLLAFIFWLQRFIYNRFWSRNLDVQLIFSAKTGTEGGKIMLTEQITSRKPLPLPWLTVKFQVSRYLLFPDNIHASITDDYYREDLFSIGMYQRISRTLPVLLKKRGYYTIKSIDLISSDLLLTTKLVGHTKSSSVLTVCPRLIQREELAIPYQQLIGEVLTKRSLYPDPFEFRAIREYQSFDTLKSINWLATARTGDLKVNVNEVTASREVLILLNVEPDGAFYEEALIEEGIRIAASMLQYLAEDGVNVSLVSNARDIITHENLELSTGQSMQHVQQMHELLGRLDLTQKPLRFVDLINDKSYEMEHDPVLMMISLNCDEHLCSRWDALLNEGHRGLWVLPRHPDKDHREPDIQSDVFCWEVKRFAG